MKLGSIVRSKQDTGVCRKGEIGVCYEVYHLGKDHTGYSFIFERGGYCGWNQDELHTLEDLGTTVHPTFRFSNVLQLERDFQHGRFNHAFDIGRALPSDPLQDTDGEEDTARCTDGHGQTCQTSKHPDCRCACHGKNHGVHPSLF